ncbi:AraC family transcriptional regulator [Chitinophaga nivalis]|uniref:AraC family transcriptional regulator n=1 Tax=Chitinophaga nivalis TaxID=2991709 RepID=A0ABT3IT38_9BACT|nr:AraC family transcriptional regulator [Chitinophaga nivalis]MCW3463169.1 AraC family transcriptional regulator [Chitinophaga nivalis]MCW3487141.1 AraC family transcriptional regulator [Chitinophaga nivalis]
MGKEHMRQSVEVLYKVVEECPVTTLQLTFFQVAYVISGTGTMRINGHEMPYRAANLFLLTPQDHYTFEIGTTTEFLLVRFDHSYIKEYQWKGIDHMAHLLDHATHMSGCILKNKPDEALVKSIVDSLVHEIHHQDLYNEDLIMHFVNALIVISARNISKIKPAHLKQNADKRILEIINYIKTNIYYPQKLKAVAMGEAFGISTTYLGSYFKTQSGETIQHFIATYKIRMIEHRLKFSDRRINEIALEFGFADESHLNKFFRKHKGINLTGYRKAEAG